jgi:uncharacterized membrane protein YjgN (DUF898 family)
LRLVEEAALLQMGNKAVVKQAVVKLVKGREKLDGAVRVRTGLVQPSCVWRAAAGAAATAATAGLGYCAAALGMQAEAAVAALRGKKGGK